MTSSVLAGDVDKWALWICVKLTGTLLWLSPRVAALATMVAEAGAKLIQLSLLLNCHCFILPASSELALLNPAGQKAAAQGWPRSSLVVAKTSPSTPESVPGVGSINGTQQFQSGFQSKQRGVGSHPHVLL